MRKKIFYIPGMMSLIGLPILFYLFLPKPKPDYTSFKLYIPSDEKPQKEEIAIFSKSNVYSSIKGKKIEQIQLHNVISDFASEEYYHLEKLQFISDEVKRLQFTNDTSTVLRVEFFDENTYADFMYVLNLALVYKYKRYVFMDDYIYFIPNPPYKEPQYNIKFIIDNDIVQMDESSYALENNKPSKWKIFVAILKYNFQDSNLNSRDGVILSSAFIILILIPAIIRIKRTKTNFKESK
jgi:sulfur relay (sulfurtransferase) DsrF/TusC family protein